MIRVTVLGSCGTYPLAGRACSGYLLEAEAIWLSHLHIDHVSDLPVVNYAMRFGNFPHRQLPVYGPAGWADHLRRFVSLQSSDTAETGHDAIEQVFEVPELSDGRRIRLGPLQLTAVATRHSVETYGVRAVADGGVVAYSADSGPCDALGVLAADADLFICEAAWRDWPEEARPIHLTPQLAGEWAARSDARRLLLTHLRAPTVPEVARERAIAVYSGEVSLAREGDMFEFGGNP